MSKIIKQVDFSDVHPLVNKPYATLYNNTMKRALGEELTQMFAPMEETKTIRRWVQPAGVKGDFRSIVEAPEDIQGLLVMLWEKRKAELQVIIKDLPSVGDLEKILIIPKQNYIYYTEIEGAENDVPNQRFRLLITGWACEFGNPKDKGQDVAASKRVEAENKHQQVTLLMVDEKSHPIQNAKFIYLSSSHNIRRAFETDEYGEYYMGPCLVNSFFTCEYQLTGQQRSFEVKKNIPRYELQFAPFVNAKVKVVNQHGEPLSDIQLTATYGNQTFTAVTDGLGETTFHDLLYLGCDVLMHLSAQTKDSESIDVKVENETSRNYYVLSVHTQDPMRVSLLVLLDGQPVSGYSVSIEFAGNTAIYASNENGVIPLYFLKDKDIFQATSIQDEQQKKQYVVEYGTEQYVFNVLSPEKEEPEQEPEQEPEKGKEQDNYKDDVPNIDDFSSKRILVVRDYLGNPVPLFTVRLTCNGTSVDMQTDEEGKVLLPEEWVSGDKFKIEPVSEIIRKKDDSGKINIKTDNLKNDSDENSCITIEDGKNEYSYVLPEPEPEPLHRHIQILDDNNNPVAFYSLRITYKEQLLDSDLTLADADGRVSLPLDWNDGEWFDVYDSKTNISQRYQLQPMTQEYIFKLPPILEEQNVYIRVIDQNNTIVSDYPLVIQIGDKIKQDISDANGCVVLGNLQVQQKFIVASGHNGNNQRSYIVEKDKDEYIYQIVEEDGNVIVQLLDKDKKCVPNAQLNLINKSKENFSHYTDIEGCIEVSRSFFTEGERVRVHIEMSGMKVKDTGFKYESKYNHYIVRLKEPFPWGCLWRLLLFLLLCLLLLVRCEKDVSVIALMGGEQPLQGVTVNMKYTEYQLYKDGSFLYKKEHANVGVTGQDGRCVFEKQPCSIFSWIFYTLQRAYVEGRYSAKHTTGDFLFHWRFTDYPLYFPQESKIKVISSKTGQPLSGASVKLWTTDKSCDSLSLITSSDGFCFFQCSDKSAKVTKLLATCNGYSGTLYKDIPIKNFVDSVFIIPLDPPNQCDTEVNNGDGTQGNHAVQDFIIGKNSKGLQIQFDYYTDSAPDHIMIYGGSSQEYSSGTAPLLWEFYGATNTTDYTTQYSIMLTLNSNIICVVVDEGTNWGYYIHCPQ